MTEKRFTSKVVDWWHDVDKVRVVFDKGDWIDADGYAKLLNALYEENEQLKQKVDFYKYFQKDARELEKENERLKKELERCKDWINSDQNDYELTLAFIKNKGYSLKDVLEYEKELKSE